MGGDALRLNKLKANYIHETILYSNSPVCGVWGGFVLNVGVVLGNSSFSFELIDAGGSTTWMDCELRLQRKFSSRLN